MMRVEMDNKMTNEAIKRGDMPMIMQTVEKRLHPEAAYFTTTDGVRTGYLFFDMDDPSDMPSVAEPFFVGLGAKITVSPAMTMDEVDKGLKKAAQLN